MAPRARGRPAKVNTQAAQLSAALDFISVAVSEHEFWHEHIKLGDKFAIAHNGLMAAGHPIAEELSCYPHAGKLKAAINKCGKSLAIVQTPGGKLSIKGDKLNALVPCLPAADVPQTAPCAPVYALDCDPLKEAFRVCGTLATEAAKSVIEASLLLNGVDCSSTNRQIVLQYWHGLNMPPNIVIPKVFAAAIASQTKKITGFGFAWANAACDKVQRITFYFEDGSWIASICYADNWPVLTHLFADQSFPTEVPAGLFEGMAAVHDFNDNGYCTFANGKVQSHRSELEGAQYDVPGVQAGKQFGAKAFLKVAALIKTIDYTTHPTKAVFFGDSLRGCIAAVIDGSEGPEAQQIQPTEQDNDEENGSDANDTDTGQVVGWG